MVGAFVGLNASSYWIDELFTTWVVSSHAGLPGLLSRLSADTHSPLYYLLAGGWSALFGSGETALRGLSAILACLSLLVLVFGLPRTVSWPGRLFAAAVAAGGAFWFTQSQNARDYSLSLVLSASLCALYLRSLDKPDDKRLALALAGIGAFGTLVNFYIGLLAAAVGLSRFLLARSGKRSSVLIAAAPTIVTLGYVFLIVRRYAQFDLHGGWMRNDVNWYWDQGQSVIGHDLGPPPLLFISLAGVVWIMARRSVSRLALSLILPPVLVLAMALVSSSVFAPNFTDTHFMTCAPFLWALLALAYDYLAVDLAKPLRLAAHGLALLVAAAGAWAPLARHFPRNEEWRESARYVGAEPACAGQPVPIVSGLDLPSRNHFDDTFIAYDYRYYLTGSHPLLLWPKAMAEDGDIPAGIAPVVAARSRGGCPIVLWAVHSFWNEADAADVAAQLSSRLHAKIQVRSFAHYSYEYGGVHIQTPNFVFVRAG
jgi:hypothetical protein